MLFASTLLSIAPVAAISANASVISTAVPSALGSQVVHNPTYTGTSEFTYGGKTYTVNGTTVFTITDCSCTDILPTDTILTSASSSKYDPDVTVTKNTTVFTTICDETTTFTHGGKTYTVTEPTTITITECPEEEETQSATASPTASATVISSTVTATTDVTSTVTTCESESSSTASSTSTSETAVVTPPQNGPVETESTSTATPAAPTTATTAAGPSETIKRETVFITKIKTAAPESCVPETVTETVTVTPECVCPTETTTGGLPVAPTTSGPAAAPTNTGSAVVPGTTSTPATPEGPVVSGNSTTSVPTIAPAPTLAGNTTVPGVTNGASKLSSGMIGGAVVIGMALLI